MEFQGQSYQPPLEVWGTGITANVWFSFLLRSSGVLSHLFSPTLSQTLCLTVSVGFEYETCPSLILWEKRTALLQGFELDPSNLGGWSLDKHHILNVKSGMLGTRDGAQWAVLA